MNKDGNRPIVSINVLPLVKHNAGQASKYTDGVHTVITPQQSVPARYIDPKAKNRSRFFCARLPSTPNRQDKPPGWPAGCFLALGSGLGLVGTASSRR